MIIVGISGKRGVGKTSLANYMTRHHGFVKVSLSEPLKDLASTLFDFDPKDFTDITRKEKPWREYEWSPREFLIHLGEFMRYHDKDYWLKLALAQCSKKGGYYVFDDIRFRNEADAIRGLGGKVVRLNRYEKENPYGKNLDIPSETDLDNYKFDVVIEDCVNKSLKDLHEQGDRMLEQFAETGK